MDLISSGTWCWRRWSVAVWLTVGMYDEPVRELMGYTWSERDAWLHRSFGRAVNLVFKFVPRRRRMHPRARSGWDRAEGGSRRTRRWCTPGPEPSAGCRARQRDSTTVRWAPPVPSHIRNSRVVAHIPAQQRGNGRALLSLRGGQRLVKACDTEYHWPVEHGENGQQHDLQIESHRPVFDVVIVPFRAVGDRGLTARPCTLCPAGDPALTRCLSP